MSYIVASLKNKKQRTIREWETSGLLETLTTEEKKQLVKLFNKSLKLIDFTKDNTINGYCFSDMTLPAIRTVWRLIGNNFSVSDLIDSLQQFISMNYEKYDLLKSIWTRYGQNVMCDNEAELCYDFAIYFADSVKSNQGLMLDFHKVLYFNKEGKPRLESTKRIS